MDWTQIYRDAVTGKDIKLVRADPPEGIIDLNAMKPCRIVPCPGSYFPAHDEQCEMSWDEEDFAYTDCQCEPRARASWQE
jgi:hypothetical protein